MIESYQLGVNSYIVKPVNFERFAEAVQHLVVYWCCSTKRPRSKECRMSEPLRALIVEDRASDARCCRPRIGTGRIRPDLEARRNGGANLSQLDDRLK